ncbi:MAG: Kelch repeat-containing protein [Bryobacteraceae bacterium]
MTVRLVHCSLAVLLVAASQRAEPPVRIHWELGPDYPFGIQDSAMGIVGGALISAGGFTRHPLQIVAKYPGAFGGQKSGFTALTFALSLQEPGRGWERIADVPGPPRQAAAAAVVGDALYVVGGFNYTAPHTYREVYRLRKVSGQWRWDRISADLPWPVSEPGVAVLDKRIYLVGGADFYRLPSEKSEDFASERGRTGQPVGKALLMLDTEKLAAGWQRLPDLPGTSRFDTAVAAARGKIYSLGGVHRTGGAGYRNAVDSWAFDPATGKWSRLPDAPQGSNRRAVAWRDRYLVLLAGYRYNLTQYPDGKVTDVYSAEDRKRKSADFFEDTVLVYDTVIQKWSQADGLRERTSWPMADVAGDRIYALGGEGGPRLFHPATLQIGTIQTLRAGGR